MGKKQLKAIKGDDDMMAEKGKERGKGKERKRKEKVELKMTVIIKVSYNVTFMSM